MKMIGQEFGSLTVLRRAPAGKTAHAYFVCQCSCGAEHIARGALLRTGDTIRCRKCAAKAGIESRGKVEEPDFALSLYGKVAAGATQLELLDLCHEHIKRR